MMQCSRCGTLLPDQTLYCHNCGLTLNETPQFAAQPTVAAQATVNETPAPVAPPPPPMSSPPSMEAGWSEFGGVQSPSGTWGGYPPAAPAPGSYTYPGSYPSAAPAPGGYTYPSNYPYMPGAMPPPVMPAPRRRGPSLVVIMVLVVVMVGLVFGGIWIGVNFAQKHNGATSAQATTIANSTPDAAQLYQQVTSRPPLFTDSLQKGSLSSWEEYDGATYGCKLVTDGLHVHIQDAQQLTYCTSGHGKFGDFAIQVDMNILTGAAGGITFRGDNKAGNFYYFLVYPNGKYRISLDQNHKWVSDLADSTSTAYVSGFKQKNTLTVIAQGSHINFYINQKFVTSVQDSTYATGYVGLMADDHDSPADVLYTNVKIWSL